MKNNANNPVKITARQKYNEVVEEFIQKLENNDVEPWTKSWSLSSKLPSNFQSGNQYNGMNIITLMNQNFKDSRWLTFHQVKSLGGSIKKGAKSTPIFFMKPTEKEVLDEESGEVQTEQYFLMQSYNVFNIEQTEGIDYQPEITGDKNTITEVQNYIDNIGIETFRGEPAYSPNDDCIFMPHSSEFESADEFYSTYFHELGHSTGHKDRLDRFEKHTVYGDPKYAFEELIAELSSAFLSLDKGIKPSSKKQTAYLQHWITAFKERPQILYSAASHASKAVNYLNDMAMVKSMTKVQNFDITVDIEKSKYQTQSRPQSKTKSKSYAPQAS